MGVRLTRYRRRSMLWILKVGAERVLCAQETCVVLEDASGGKK